MAEVVTGERPVIGYAQPLSRLQVSWGSILAGAATALASGFLLWMLAMAIIWSAMEPTVRSVRAGLLAAWITGMICTIIGGYLGGVIAGYLPGNPRRLITCAHGLLAWCVMFLVASIIQLSVIGGILRTTTGALVTTATTAVQTTGEAVGGAAGGQGNLSTKAEAILTSLGYTQDEARSMVTSAQQDLQRVLRGRANTEAAATQAAQQARGALDTFFSGAAVYTWLWFGTWLLAAVASVAGAASVLKRVRLVPERELVRDRFEGRPLRPAEQT